MEKLLDSTEHFDNNSDMECISPSVFQNIVVGPEMFLTSLSRRMNSYLHNQIPFYYEGLILHEIFNFKVDAMMILGPL
jgi:hypothetical protein